MITKDEIGAKYNVGAFSCPKCGRMLANKLIQGYAEKAEDLEKRGKESEDEGKYWTATCAGCSSVCHSYFEGKIEWRISPISFKVKRESIKDVIGRGQPSDKDVLDPD